MCEGDREQGGGAHAWHVRFLCVVTFLANTTPPMPPAECAVYGNIMLIANCFFFSRLATKKKYKKYIKINKYKNEKKNKKWLYNIYSWTRGVSGCGPGEGDKGLWLGKRFIQLNSKQFQILNMDTHIWLAYDNSYRYIAIDRLVDRWVVR